jgi:hypothetical protein
MAMAWLLSRIYWPLLFIFCFTNAMGESRETYTYSLGTGSQKKNVVRTVAIATDSVYMTYFDGTIRTVSVCNTDYSQKRWEYSDSVKNTNLVFVRNGGSVRGLGIYKAKPFEREFAVDSLPWVQAMEFYVGPRLKAGDGRVSYWSIRPTDMKMFKMNARPEEKEEIESAGSPVDAMRVRVSVAGMLSAFWHASYWFRLPQYSFVKYRAVHGGPGTPATTIELVTEDTK